MRDQEKAVEKKAEPVEDKETTTGLAHEAQEPWLPVETKLVVGSVIAGVITLIVLAIFVHIFLLGGH